MKTPDFELLQVLIAVAESENLIEAARKIGISQPGVSLKLKILEEQVGLPVFSLEGRRKSLTRYGRSLYELARGQSDGLARSYENLNREYEDATRLTARIGCRPELFEALSSRLRFAGRIEFTPLSSHAAVTSLLDHTLDLAISTERPDSREIVARKIMTSEAKLIVHRKYLTGKSARSFIKDADVLLRTPCVMYRSDGHLVRELLKVVASSGADLDSLNVRLIADDWRLLCAAVGQGWGYAVVPNYVHCPVEDIVTIPVPPAISPRVDFHLLFHRHLRQLNAFRQLIDSAMATRLL